MLIWAFENTLMAALLAGVVTGICLIFRKHPALCHFVWFLVLVRLITPPISLEIWPPEAFRETVDHRIGTLFTTTASNTDPRALGRLEPSSDHSLRQGSSASGQSEPDGSAPSRPSFLNPGPSAHDPAYTLRTSEDLEPVDESDSGGELSAPVGFDRSFGMRDRVVEIEAKVQESRAWDEEMSSSSKSGDESAGTKNASEIDSESDPESDREGKSDDASVMREIIPVDLRSLPTTPALGMPSTNSTARGGLFELTKRDWLVAVLLAVWMSGMVAVAVVNLIRIGRFHRLLASSRSVDDSFRRFVDSVAAAVGIGAPEVRVSGAVESPVVWKAGRRSVLLWPTSLPQDANLGEYRGIVVHELAHLARRDHWYAWFEMLVSCVLWWNPLVWIARRNIRHYADLACDAWVISLYPNDRRTYAMSLIDAVDRMSFRSRLASLRLTATPAPALGFGETARRAFERRITMIARGNAVYRVSPLLAAASLACCALFLPSWAGGAIEESNTIEVIEESSVDPAIREDVEVALAMRRAERFEKGDSIDEAVAEYEYLATVESTAGNALDRLGYLHASQGRFNDAADAFARQAKMHHESARAYYNLACMHAVQGNEDDALKNLEKAVAYGCDLGEHALGDSDLKSLHDDDRFAELTRQMMSIAELTEEAAEAIGDERYIDAAVAYGKLTERAPQVGEFHHLLAYSSIMAGNLDVAEPAIERQIELEYALPVAMYNMACIRSLEGRTDEAVEYLRKSAKMGFGDAELMKNDPDLANIRETDEFASIRQKLLDQQRMRDEAELALKYEDWEKAADLFEEVASIEESQKEGTNPGWAYYKLGVARFYLGEYELARRAFMNGIRSGDSVANGLYNIACCYGQMADAASGSSSDTVRYYTVRAGDTLAGIAAKHYGSGDEWKAIVEANPTVGPDRLRVGQILRLPARDETLMSGSTAEYVATGLEYLRKAVELGQDDVDHMRADVDLGALRSSPEFEEIVNQAADQQVLEMFGAVDWKHLEKKADRAIEDDADDGEAYLHLGWAKLRLGEYESARQAFMRQGELGMMPQIAWYNVACCYAMAGDADSALQWLEKAIADGMNQYDHMVNDPDLRLLHDHPKFRELIEQGLQEKKKMENAKKKGASGQALPSLLRLAELVA